MKNENIKKINLRAVIKIIFLPITLLRVIFITIKEKLEYSIRLKLSLRYIKILIVSFLAAGLGIILVFGTLKIQARIVQDYAPIAESINKGSLDFKDINKFSEEQARPVRIYDSDNELVFSSEEDLLEHFYNNEANPVSSKEKIFVPIKRTYLIPAYRLRLWFIPILKENCLMFIQLPKLFSMCSLLS
jgi:hypothetical protein